MRVLGYSFRRDGDAERARRELVTRFQLSSSDARLAPLADDGSVLGVRVVEDDLTDVKQILQENGGEPVVDVDEAWTGIKP